MAYFVWLPLQDPSINGEIQNAGGITAFIEATIFEFGSVLLMIEAVTENRTDCFSWALGETLGEREMVRLRPASCVHHHENKGNLVGRGKASEGESKSCLKFGQCWAKMTQEILIPKSLRLPELFQRLNLDPRG
jgi:hypothetical protein